MRKLASLIFRKIASLSQLIEEKKDGSRYAKRGWSSSSIPENGDYRNAVGNDGTGERRRAGESLKRFLAGA